MAQRVAVVTGAVAGIGAAITARRIGVNVIWPGSVTTSLKRPLFRARCSGDVPSQVTSPIPQPRRRSRM